MASASNSISITELIALVDTMSLEQKDTIRSALGISDTSAKKPRAKKTEGDDEEVKEKKPRAKKVEEKPAVPTLKAGWIFKPYEKGAKKGQDRWYNEAEDEFTENRTICFDIPTSDVSTTEKKKAGRKKLSPEEKQAKLDAMTPEELAERNRKIKERTDKAKATRAAKKAAAAGGSAEEASEAEE